MELYDLAYEAVIHGHASIAALYLMYRAAMIYPGEIPHPQVALGKDASLRDPSKSNG